MVEVSEFYNAMLLGLMVLSRKYVKKWKLNIRECSEARKLGQMCIKPLSKQSLGVTTV